MSHLIAAEFASAADMCGAASSAASHGCRAKDALTPFPVPQIMEHLSYRPKRPVGWVMVIAGALAAGVIWLLQWHSSVIDYPIISGNRPLYSWQVFFLVSFEACILAGGIAGFVAFARDSRLPSLNHALFEIVAIERASQDRFFLIFETAEEERGRVAQIVAHLNALSVNEVTL